MTKLEKREDAKMRIRTQLKAKVRAHRPAEKVIEIAIALAEERLEAETERLDELKWQFEYLGTLKPEEIEQEKKS
ncbi:hypothetical protein [ANMV-1 virus]|nr:hypothetical protein [ANMV-1 virus]